MKKYIVSAFVLLAAVSSANAATDKRQSAISPIDQSCKTFLNESYVPTGWRHISSCERTNNTNTLQRRTVKKLPNYGSRSQYQKTTPKVVKKVTTTKPSLKNLRPRTTSTNSTKKTSTRRALPNYGSSFSKRFQLAKAITPTKKNTTKKTVTKNKSTRISASSSLKKKLSTGKLSTNTWSRSVASRTKNIDKNSTSQFWRSRNSLLAQKKSQLNKPKQTITAKLKQRYVGERRIGSLKNVSSID